MDRKIQKEFVDMGFGFPVILSNVPMIKVRGQWTPDINYNELAKQVLIALCEKSTRLCGDEVKFIRLHFEMTLEQFAKRFGVSHVAVIKWEKAKDKCTNMSWSTEKDVRLFVINNLFTAPEKLKECYIALERVRTTQKRNIKVNLQDHHAYI